MVVIKIMDEFPSDGTFVVDDQEAPRVEAL